ncbi:MAG: InlB B-repeat-containing protein [Erysipelotrichaceae bacterium]|nr:InlB B-repeat-containing protein [Erysipelotrichaceae bacterium]
MKKTKFKLLNLLLAFALVITMMPAFVQTVHATNSVTIDFGTDTPSGNEYTKDGIVISCSEILANNTVHLNGTKSGKTMTITAPEGAKLQEVSVTLSSDSTNDKSWIRRDSNNNWDSENESVVTFSNLNRSSTLIYCYSNSDHYYVTAVTVTVMEETYSVTLNTNGGTIHSGNITSYTYGTGATLPTDITKDGFAFGGWYDNEDLTGTPVSVISAADTGDKEFWAKWNVVEYPLWVAGTRVTSANASNITSADTVTVSYDADTNTLTLDNASITTGSGDYGIVYSGANALNIVLEGNSVINNFPFGIQSQRENKDLTISGNGSITVSGSLGDIFSNGSLTISGTVTVSAGLYANNELIINGGTIDNHFKDINARHGVTINGGTVNAIVNYPENYNSYGIQGSVTINGGTLIAVGIGSSNNCRGITGDLTVGENAVSVTVIGSGKAVDGTVKNSIAGAGWADTEGTEGMTAIAVNSNPGQKYDYKMLQFPVSSYTVSFEMGGHYTPVPDSQTVERGEKATKPAKPVNYEEAVDYSTTGLRFRMWDEVAPADLTYDTLWDGGFNFNGTAITKDTTLHAIYESILTLKVYDLTNNQGYGCGTVTYSDIYIIEFHRQQATYRQLSLKARLKALQPIPQKTIRLSDGQPVIQSLI